MLEVEKLTPEQQLRWIREVLDKEKEKEEKIMTPEPTSKDDK